MFSYRHTGERQVHRCEPLLSGKKKNNEINKALIQRSSKFLLIARQQLRKTHVKRFKSKD